MWRMCVKTDLGHISFALSRSSYLDQILSLAWIQKQVNMNCWNYWYSAWYWISCNLRIKYTVIHFITSKLCGVFYDSFEEIRLRYIGVALRVFIVFWNVLVCRMSHLLYGKQWRLFLIELTGNYYVSLCFIQQFTGYVGSACQYHVCNVSVTCLNNGTCVGDGQCACPDGFTGSLCETDMCDLVTCQNNGTCYQGHCVCPSGVAGYYCSVDLCDYIYCLNDATCMGGGCICPIGFAGTRCERNTNECLSNPCGRTGVCEDHVSGYVCHCAEHYTGRLCETPLEVITYPDFHLPDQAHISIVEEKVTIYRGAFRAMGSVNNTNNTGGRTWKHRFNHQGWVQTFAWTNGNKQKSLYFSVTGWHINCVRPLHNIQNAMFI